MRAIHISRVRRGLAAAGATLAFTTLVLTASPAHAINGNVPDNRTPDATGEITAMYWHGLNRDPPTRRASASTWGLPTRTAAGAR